MATVVVAPTCWRPARRPRKNGPRKGKTRRSPARTKAGAHAVDGEGRERAVLDAQRQVPRDLGQASIASGRGNPMPPMTPTRKGGGARGCRGGALRLCGAARRPRCARCGRCARRRRSGRCLGGGSAAPGARRPMEREAWQKRTTSPLRPLPVRRSTASSGVDRRGERSRGASRDPAANAKGRAARPDAS